MSWECRFGFRPRDLRLRPTSCGLGNRFQIKTSQGVSNVDIGFIGLGAMGSAVATNLVNKSGHAVTVWNRTEANAEPLVAAIGQKVFRIGDKPSAANLVKLCGNFTILATIETMAEAMALAEKGGVPKAKLLEVLTGTLFDAAVYRTYGSILVEERFTPAGFKAPLGLKDMRLVGEAADKSRVAMPLLSLVRDHLLETIAKEGEDIDWSGIGKTVARNAGL